MIFTQGAQEGKCGCSRLLTFIVTLILKEIEELFVGEFYPNFRHYNQSKASGTVALSSHPMHLDVVDNEVGYSKCIVGVPCFACAWAEAKGSNL
jgi:hypothetical protein